MTSERRGRMAASRSPQSASNTTSQVTSSSASQVTSGPSKRSHSLDDNSRPKRVKTEGTAKKTDQYYRLQCANYAMEMLNRRGIHTHVIGSLIVDGELELHLYTRLRTCYAHRFSFIDDPVFFLHIVLAFSNMSLAQWGVPELIQPHILAKPLLLKTLTPDRTMYLGVEFKLGESTLRAGKIGIFPRGLISRGTWTLEVEAISGELCKKVGKGVQLFMKLSAISKDREQESRFIEKARGMATDGHAWVLNHLPNVYASGVIPNDNDFKGLFDSQSFELRELRYMIMERLYPITHLIKPREFSRAFRDTIRCHQWLVTTPKIMHHDISVNNLMCRRNVEQKRVYGVLNDFDLALWIEGPENGVLTSIQRTGTKPFIALELLQPNESPFGYTSVHRVRFELESFLYVLAWISCRFDIREEIPNPPFEEWSQGTWRDIYCKKNMWLQNTNKEPLTNTYETFQKILRYFKKYLYKGRHSAISYNFRMQPEGVATAQEKPVDPETLSGAVTYGNFLSSFDHMDLDNPDDTDLDDDMGLDWF